VLVFKEQVLEKVLDTDAVDCWNDNICVADACLNLIRRLGLDPVKPCHLFRNESHIKQGCKFSAQFVGESQWFLAGLNINLVFFLDVLSVD
jgi:hypothetical protein